MPTWRHGRWASQAEAQLGTPATTWCRRAAARSAQPGQSIFLRNTALTPGAAGSGSLLLRLEDICDGDSDPDAFIGAQRLRSSQHTRPCQKAMPEPKGARRPAGHLTHERVPARCPDPAAYARSSGSPPRCGRRPQPVEGRKAVRQRWTRTRDLQHLHHGATKKALMPTTWADRVSAFDRQVWSSNAHQPGRAEETSAPGRNACAARRRWRTAAIADRVPGALVCVRSSAARGPEDLIHTWRRDPLEVPPCAARPPTVVAREQVSKAQQGAPATSYSVDDRSSFDGRKRAAFTDPPASSGINRVPRQLRCSATYPPKLTPEK